MTSTRRWLFRYLVCLVACLTSSQLPADDAISFRKDIAPILLENCVACHGSKKAEGGYRASSYDLLTRAGDSGAAPIDFVNLPQSEMLRRIASSDPDERMPAESDPLSAADISKIKVWLDQGGKNDAESSTASLFEIVPDPVYPSSPIAYPAPVPVTAILFSEAADELIVSGYHELTIWRVTDGVLVRRIGNLGERVHRIVSLPGTNQLAVACGSPGKLGEVRIISRDSGNVERVLHRATDEVLDLSVSPNGTRLATSSADGLVRVYNLNPLALHKTISSHSDYVTSVAWSPDSSKLATASRDKTAKVFDSESGELLTTCSLHQQPVRSVIFAADGKQIVSLASDNMLYRWDAETGTKVAEAAIGAEAYQPIALGGTIFLACSDHSVKQFDVAQNKIVSTYSGHKTAVLSQAIAPDAKWIAAGSLDGEVRIWNIADSSLIKSFVAVPK